MNRVILHSDLNNFYASVECLYNPEIRDKPVAVCGSQSTRHGIVLAKNYHAKYAGVQTGEAIWEAKNKCPKLVIVPPNYLLYLRFSISARKIYENYTNLVEPFGIDESWLDVTESTNLFGNGKNIAFRIKERIKNELGITVSVGVSYNKIYAKMGSDMNKPDAITIINKANYRKKIFPLPIRDLLYVGGATEKKLKKTGIMTVGDLAATSPKFLGKKLGKWGELLWTFANGYDNTPVTATDYEIPVKGIGNSLTACKDLTSNEDVKILIYVLSDSVAERLRRHHFKGKTVQISIRDSELGYIERQGQLGVYTCVSSEIAEKAYEIFLNSWNWNKNIRALGVRVTKLMAAGSHVQLSLFTSDRKIKRELLDKCVDNIRYRFGHYSIQRAILLKDSELNANPVQENVIQPVPYRSGSTL